jgi:hypothetical protein
LTPQIKETLGCDFLTSGMMIYASNDVSGDLNASNSSYTTTEKINRETYTVKITYVHKIDLEDLKKTDPLVNKSEAV